LIVILLSLLHCFTNLVYPPQSSGSAGNGQTESTWNRITGKDEEFSILMPGTPSGHSNYVTSVYGRRKERIYSSYSKGSVYLVVSYDNRSSKDILESFRAHHLYKGELSLEREIIVDGHEGKEYQLTFGGATGRLQIHVTKKHGYAVAIIQALDDPPLTQYFFSSLSLEPTGSVSKKPSQGPPSNQASNLPQADQTEAPFAGKDVTRRATAVSKPEPSLTNEARDKRLSGTVVLRGVFSPAGEFILKKVVRGLGSGLTENALDAAKNIKFIPAVKDGRFVSQYVQLEYNFRYY